MFTHIPEFLSAACLGLALISSTASAQTAAPGADGLIKVRSAYSVDETIARIKSDIAAKGIQVFMAVDQSKLAADAGIKLRGPVRLLVLQDEAGGVWAAYTDFAWIAQRHGITDRQPQFAMASGVVESITSSVRAE